MKPPILTIVTPVYNAAKDLPRFFSSLKEQTLKRSDYEILIIDGGSTDSTIEISRNARARIIHNPKKLAEPGVSLGIQNAKSDLIMVLAVDNIFKQSNALETMLTILQNPNISAVFPKHESAPDDSIFSKYFNTFTDPYTHFVYGSASNGRTFSKIYATKIHNETYDIFDFSSSDVYPLIALAQGFCIKKKDLPKRTDSGNDDVLTVYSLLDKGKNIAFAHSVSLFHFTIRDLGDFMRKQKRAVENALVRRNSGIYQRKKYLTRYQKLKQLLFVPYAITIVAPTINSIYNAVVSGNVIWLFHVPISFLSACAIVFTVVELNIHKFFYDKTH